MMSWVVSTILFVPIISMPCSAFVGDIYNQRHQVQLPTTTSIVDRHRHQQRKEMNAFVQIPTVNNKGPGTTRISSRETTTTTSSTQLSLHPTTGASLAIVGSSLCGMQISRLFPSGGILGTLISAAFFGNVCTKWIPNKHPLYDLCFTLFLPGSLTLLLLAYRPPRNEFDNSTDQNATALLDSNSTDSKEESNEKEISTKRSTTDAQNSISACIRRIAVPFLITSVASLLGCLLSYWCTVTFGWFQNPGSSATAASIGKAGDLARITTGCMSASYVGGSVNFMSTARIVGAPTDLIGSLVTADLFTMAIYFSFLSSSLEWEWLVSKFASVKTTQTNTDKKVASNGNLENTTKLESADEDESLSNLKAMTLTSIPLLISTFFIVQLANRVEHILGRIFPGSACALIALVAPLLNSFVQAKDFWNPFSRAATIWSDFFFLSFFASIGVAANMSSALSMGPTCLLFSAIALMVHVIGTVFGCLLWKKVMAIFASGKRSSPPSLDLEDVWIASNAAIGGPATAAAFCGRMKKRDPGKLQGRTISATVWGVVGYAIGTIVGVSMYRLL